jgi:tetratricopeptide (TPR) repeat protein
MSWPLAVLLLLLAQATDYPAQGLKALEEKNYAAAAEQFAKAVEADPKDYVVRFHLALVNGLLGKDSEAIAGYKSVLELKPQLYEAQVNLGMVLLRQKQPREAVPHLEAAAAAKPKEFQPNFLLAEALLGAGEPAKAEPYFKVAAELDPKSADAEAGLGRSRARQNRLAEAAANFRRAAELDTAYKEALLELAPLYEKNDDNAAALEIYAQFPANAAARERRTQLLIHAGRLTEAGPLLEQSLAADPRNAQLRMTYGRVLRDLKKYPAAAAEFYRAAQIQPDSVEAWNELAGMLMLLEDYPRTLDVLDRLKALGAEVPGHYYLRAIIFDKAKQLRPALENYQKFLTLSQGKSPDEEFKARQRVRILEKEINHR